MRRLSAAALILTLLAGLVVLVPGATPCLSTELDDSVLFVDAFNAFQKKDYLLTIDKIGQLTEIFPESPLRDISLLLLARAALKSGDNELSAMTIQRFTVDFPDNSLNTTLEEDLLTLAKRRSKGEKIPPNRQLQAIALKTALDRLARESTEKERKLAAEKEAKEGIKLAIAMPLGNQLVEVGNNGQISFELVNNGAKSEEFLLSAPVPKEFTAMLTSSDRPEKPIKRVTLSPGEKFKGNMAFRMPSDRVDGFKAIFQVKAISATFKDVTFSKESLVTASAPLVRAVSKPQKTKVARGETLKYRISVLNAGSLKAHGLTVRAIIPSQLDFIGSDSGDYLQESAGIVEFRVADLETGQLAEFAINTTVRNNVTEKQEVRIQIEIINDRLQRKEIFASSAAIVQE